MVDYLEADHAFSLARLASPYNLEGMDIYSTVLYVSFKILILHYIWLLSSKHNHAVELIVRQILMQARTVSF